MSSDSPLRDIPNPIGPSLVPHSSFSLNPSPKGKLLFDSQSGIAKILPPLLHVILSRFSIDLDLVDLIDYDPDGLPYESLVVIVASSVDGKAPVDAEFLSKWLSERAKDSCGGSSMILKGCRFAVFGVCLSSHEYCHNFVQDIERCMTSLGASRVVPSGEAILNSYPFHSIFMAWCFDLIIQFRGCTSAFERINSLPEFGEDIGDYEFHEDAGDNASAQEVVDLKVPGDSEFDKDTGDNAGELCVKEPERDPNALEVILSSVTTTHLDKQSSFTGSVFYFLLGHGRQHMLGADNLFDESEAYPVASLYRVEIKYQGDNTTINGSIGLPLFQFTSDKYPLGMGCGTIGSKLYLVGGNFHPSKHSPYCNASNKLYILDLSLVGHLATHEEISKIIEIKDFPYGNKIDPIVVTVQKKLFVLPRDFKANNGINPTINSYDPEKDEWKTFDIELPHDISSPWCFMYLSSYHKVIRYLVEDYSIIIHLVKETYRFDCDTGKLYLLPSPGIIGYMLFSVGMVVHPDGCFYCLDYTRSHLVAYKEHEYYQDSMDSFVLSEFFCEEIEGVVSHFRDVGEENRLLVVRSGRGIVDASKLNIAFDFLIMVKATKALKCKTYSITYNVENWDGHCGHIKACVPMNFLPRLT